MYPSHLDVIRLPSKGSKLWRVGSWILAVDGDRLGGENSTSASDAAGQLGYRNRVPFTFFLSDRVIQVDSTNWKFNVFHIGSGARRLQLSGIAERDRFRDRDI